MKRQFLVIFAMLCGASILAQPIRARAQGQHTPQGGNQQLLPISGSAEGRISQVTSFFPIPVTPTIVDARQILSGESTLGPFTWTDKHTVHLDPTVSFFKPVRFTDGVALIDFLNGDALFLAWSGLEKTDLPPTERGSVCAFHITGGRGRFKGATGVGRFETVLDLAGDKLNVRFEGTILRFLPAPPGAGQ